MKIALAFVVCLGVVPAFAQGELKPFLGTLHDHTSEGGDDGKGGVADALAGARKAGFSFLGVSPHNHMIAPETYVKLGHELDAANQPGTFVTLAGFEWGVISKGGHVGVIGAKAMITAESTDWNGFWNGAQADSGALVILNHPVWGHTYGGTPTPERIARARLMEVEGGPGQYAGPELAGKPESSFREFVLELNHGWRCGVTYGEDNHSGRWGTVNHSRTGVWARELTREALMEAFNARRTFVTEDPAMSVWIESGSTAMGGEAAGPAGDVPLSVKVVSPGAVSVAVYLDADGPGGQQAMEVSRSEQGSFATTLHVGAGAYAFVVAREASGALAWSSPIWFGPARSGAPAAAARVDLNFAAPADLDSVDGVGRGSVKLITAARKSGMLFASPADLAKVPGFPADLFAKVAGQFSVSTPEETADALAVALAEAHSLVLDAEAQGWAAGRAERAERLLALQLEPLCRAGDARAKAVLARVPRDNPLKIVKQSALAGGWSDKLEAALGR